ncbi:MAG: thiol peroxidase [Propionibacteriaceae bacterium]|jgi:thiol peroxidase|nr:thiol peroxidase [Propionibacteriaceae bacterium]
MSTTHFQGQAVTTIGSLPEVGATLPDFHLADPNLNTIALADFEGSPLVLNIFPSLDTAVCAMSVRRFNQLIGEAAGARCLCVSMDLPFAAGRFCVAEGIDHVQVGSSFRSTFGEDYGVTMMDGPLRGLLARSVVVADAAGRVVYTELVPQVGQEPDYQAAMSALASAV